ncbi:MAG: 30S ribosome-binding factor RbfA, partial [Deltaproteobacteria bacterium]|nr:30S ribosome-binding factor RbfA [Deltaproteobacteria bacterium]
MKPFTRSDRVGTKIQKVLSELLRKSINDPRLETTTITGVKMSRDLRLAYIYFITSKDSTSNSKKSKEESIKGFNSALGFLKRSLARQLGLRYMPNLKFYYDESFDYGSRIDSVLESIKKEEAP